MKRIYSAENGILIQYIRDLLDAQGIPYFIRNQSLAGAVGEIPPFECWPEVWIQEDTDYADAMEIINAAVSIPAHEHLAWTCTCGEHIEGQFSNCWNCGGPRPG